MKTTGQAAEGRVQPTGSAPAESTDAAADAVESLGKMAGEDNPQPEEQADEAATGTDQDATDEQAPEGDETEEAAEESDEDGAEGEEPEGKQDHRSPRAEKRISELTAEKKQAESKAQAAETRVKDLESVVATNIGLHPDYVTEPEAKLIARARGLQARERELLKSWDGIDSADEAKAKTAAEVRTEWADVRAELDEVGPRARRMYDERLQQMVADMHEGRRLRLERGSAKRGAPAKVAATKRPAPAVALPKGSAGGQAMKAPRGAPGQSEDRFVKSGGGRDAAERELAMLVGAD